MWMFSVLQGSAGGVKSSDVPGFVESEHLNQDITESSLKQRKKKVFWEQVCREVKNGKHH